MTGFTNAARDLWQKSQGHTTEEVQPQLEPLVRHLSAALAARGVIPQARLCDTENEVIGNLLQFHHIHGALPTASSPVATILQQLRWSVDHARHANFGFDQGPVGTMEEERERVLDWMELEVVGVASDQRTRNRDDLWNAWLDARWAAEQGSVEDLVQQESASLDQREKTRNRVTRRLSRVREDIDGASRPLVTPPYRLPVTGRESAIQWGRIITFGLDSLYLRMPDAMERVRLQAGDLGVVRQRINALARSSQTDAGDAT